MKIFIFGILALTQGFKLQEDRLLDFEGEFDIDEIMQRADIKAQFDQFLNNTNVVKLKNGNDFESNEVLTQSFGQNLDPNVGMELDLSKIPPTEFAQVRKFKHIASLIMYLQKVPILGKYVYYGCYCFTNAQYDLDAGYGQAVDNIDKSCKKFHHCYNCIKKDFVIGQEKNCDGTSRSYRFRGFIDPVTMEKQIECLNDVGSCKRSICECDKKLAMDLREHEFTWNIFNHQKWGGFQKDSCRIQSRAGIEGGENEKKCCGTYPNRFPFVSKTHDGQEVGCCDGKTYDLNGPLECCDEKELVELGNCVPKPHMASPIAKGRFI